MANGINRATIIGRLGKDPEITYTNAGAAVVNFTVATKETWKDKNTGENREQAEWHRMVCYGKLAEICGKFLTKGSLAYFEGKIKTRKWTDNGGIDRYSTEIIVDTMQMLGGRSEQPKDHVDDNVGNQKQGDDFFDNSIPF